MPLPLPWPAAPRASLTRPRAAVALAAGPEPAVLVRCLCALALQRGANGLWLAPGALGAVVVPTGPVAAVEGALRGLGPSLPFPVMVTAPVPAGDWALRAGMTAATGWVGEGGVVLATLVEAVPEAGWVTQAVAALGGPLDAVLGEVVPPGSGPDAAGRYAGLLAALAARLDPDPADPAPAHGQEETASFAIRAGVLAGLGGLPVGPAGGIAGLLAALRQHDGRIRHIAGMRVEAELPPAPVEPACAFRRRLLARRAVREFWTAGIGVFERETPAFRRWAARLGLPGGALGAALSVPSFGAAWARVAEESPVLAERRPLPPEALPRETRRARLLLALARLRDGAPALPAADQAAAPAQRPGEAVPGRPSPGGSCMLRNPGGAWNRAGSCGP